MLLLFLFEETFLGEGLEISLMNGFLAGLV